LVFAGYATISEVWGRRPSGLLEREVQEMNLAYDEYDRLQRARRKWNDEHNGGDDEPTRGRRRRPRGRESFDASGYLEARRQELLDQLEAEREAEDE
jgi:hypothetical protein